MAIVKANYTKSSAGAKASIRYIQHRPGKDNQKMTRVLFGSDGVMGRHEAYRIIDEAKAGSIFFRFVISPDPREEDSEKDLHLRAVTEKTMLALEDRLHTPVAWVAVVHDDHTAVRHVHIVAVVSGRLGAQDFAELRQTASEACLEQRRHLDLVRQPRQTWHEEAGLDLSHEV